MELQNPEASFTNLLKIHIYSETVSINNSDLLWTQGRMFEVQGKGRHCMTPTAAPAAIK
jgi:hypothetical protein